jgi:KUP system potassium uptake protein
MDEPNVMRALAQCRLEHFHINLMETSFFIGREKLRLRSRRRLTFGHWWGSELFVFLAWRNRLFIFLSNLALDATEFFRIPPNRVVELGGQIEI